MAKATPGAGDGAPFSLPADLASLNAEALAGLSDSANAEMDAMLAKRDPADLPKLKKLSADRKTIQSRQAEVAAEQAEIDAQFDGFANELTPPAEEVADETAVDASPEVLEGEIVEDETPAAPQLVTASGQRPQGGARAASRETGGLNPNSHAPRLNPTLSGIRGAGPAQVVPTSGMQQGSMTASVGLPGAFEAGAAVDGIDSLGRLFESRARNMADQGGRYRARRDGDPYGGVQVASIRNDWGKDVFSDTTAQDVLDEYRERVTGMASSSKMESLVAAGGWCAPSQIRYDFFNIACEDGMIDLPTFGVERGGIQFPVSPSLADTFSPALPWYTAFSNATVPWLWTEGDDILAVTGSPTKPCIRVPCSTMSNVRLECYGICLTAGNLADNAWPESTRNFLRLLMAAHYHAQNARYIASISALATGSSLITGCSTTATNAATATLLDTAEIGAWDYRSKYGMCETDVMESVYPAWAKGAIRADLAKRMGLSPTDAFRVGDSDIASWFDVRGIRAQFVQDYQVRAAGQPGAATPITSYPTTVRNLMYAAGTVARGNGMNLDLGVVRDSTLNARNDFTAAWMEECHLIARFGHEVREYTNALCPSGMVGQASLTSCCP
jgi:hypothetical protein